MLREIKQDIETKNKQKPSKKVFSFRMGTNTEEKLNTICEEIGTDNKSELVEILIDRIYQETKAK